MTDCDDSDELLLQRYAAGDVPAFAVLYERYELRVWRYLQRHLRNRAVAEELLQEVWFAVARQAGKFATVETFPAWLFTIAHNRIVDALRSTRPRVSLDTVGCEADAATLEATRDVDSDPLRAVLAQDEVDSILRAVERLPKDQREVFLLRAEGELSLEEIATITRTSFETAKSRLRYARSKLRELLAEMT